MSEEKKLAVYIVSDAIGQSAVNIARSALSQFPELEYDIVDYTFISEYEEIDEIIFKLQKDTHTSIVFHTFSNAKMANYLDKHTAEMDVVSYDILTPVVSRISELTATEPNSKTGVLTRRLDSDYFNRIEAMEFAVNNDDGKNPKSFTEADIVILGISRTSKTPLSIFLANNNFKVANLPLVLNSELPEEIWDVDSRRIIGLTNDVNVLTEIRKERMIQYGLNPETIYSNVDHIQQEIEYANQVYEELGCKVINVANKSIEETAGKIITYLSDQRLIEMNRFN